MTSRSIKTLSILLALTAVGAARAQDADSSRWNCPALPNALVDIAVLGEDWDGVRWYYDPAEVADDGAPLWRRCVPLNSPSVEAPDTDGIRQWHGWTGEDARCQEIGWQNRVSDYGEPVTAVFVSDGFEMCSFASYVKYVADADKLSCQSMLFPTPSMLAVADPDEQRISYLQFPAGAEYALLCAIPDDEANEAGDWALYLVPGLVGEAPQ